MIVSSWSIDCVLSVAGQEGPLRVLDREDGPHGRIVCVIPGHLGWQATPGCLVRLLDEQDVENARLIAAAPELRTVLAGLVEWAARIGGWEASCWEEAHALLSRLRDPCAEG